MLRRAALLAVGAGIGATAADPAGTVRARRLRSAPRYMLCH